MRILEVTPTAAFGLGLRDDGSAAPAAAVGIEQLEPSDHLLFYTDGVTEAREGETFGIPRLVDPITRNLAAGLPAAETMRRVIRALLAHQGNKLSDDATMLLAQWRPDGPAALQP